jgi:hypothetical protein
MTHRYNQKGPVSGVIDTGPVIPTLNHQLYDPNINPESTTEPVDIAGYHR